MKILQKNSIFLFLILFFENVLLKIAPSEIAPFFYNIFFGFGGIFPLPPLGYALLCPPDRSIKQQTKKEMFIGFHISKY